MIKPARHPSIGDRLTGFSLLEVLIVLIIVGFVVALLLPAVNRNVGPAMRGTRCRNNLKQIGLALHDYHDAYGALPPAYTVSEDGRPLHSWRTLLLPYLDQSSLYDKLDLSKAWDDPRNAALLNVQLPVFNCPSHDLPPGHTTYLTVSTPESCFPFQQSRRLSDITDTPAQTLMVIEVDGSQSVPWAAPNYVEEKHLLWFSPNTGVPHEEGLNVLFADGAVRFLSGETSAEDRRAMITIAGQDKVTIFESP